MTPLPPYLIVANAFTTTGGMERANHALALHLAHRSRELHLVGHDASPELPALPNVHFHRVPRPAGADLAGMPLIDWAGRIWARRISKMGGRVVVNGGNCLWGDINWVHYVHAAWGSGWKHRWFMHQERRALPRARLVVANSQRTRADLEQYLGIEPSRIVTTLLGVDADRFAPPDNAQRRQIRQEMGWSEQDKVVGFVGAASDLRKGFDRLLEAWHILKPEVGWRLITLGTNGPSAENGVQWVGFRNDVERIVGVCDLVVAPSRYESYGLGVHEALCLGVPAITAQAAGVSEVYDATLRPLLLKDVENAEDIAAKLRHWADRMEFYRTAVRELSHRLRQRTWECVARDIVNRIEESRMANQTIKSGDGRVALSLNRRRTRTERAAEAESI